MNPVTLASPLDDDALDCEPTHELHPDTSGNARNSNAGLIGSFSVGQRVRDLIDLTKPRMNFLVVVTTAVGYYMAARGNGQWSLLIHTLVGTALTAAGASVLNQYWERTHDTTMRRTQDRPLPGGRISPLAALAWGICLAIAGIVDLNFFVNPLTSLLGALTLASYVWIYTPMKRWSTLCTIVGAVPGAVPAVMGWTAARNAMGPEAVALFGILFIWQLPHFLAIAILYREDYARGGFKMLPVVDDGLRATALQIVLWAMALVPVSLLPAMLRMAGPLYFLSALLLGLIFCGFAILCAMGRQRAEARQLFLASIVYLPLLLTSLVLDRV